MRANKSTMKAAATAALILASASVGVGGGQLPPIDNNRPKELETALFSLG